MNGFRWAAASFAALVVGVALLAGTFADHDRSLAYWAAGALVVGLALLITDVLASRPSR